MTLAAIRRCNGAPRISAELLLYTVQKRFVSAEWVQPEYHMQVQV